MNTVVASGGCGLWLLLLLTLGLATTLSAGRADLDTRPAVPLLNNLGSYQRPITTSSELAQEYFDQGLRFLYGFKEHEAIRSFIAAAQLDPRCAMAYWGIALASGPTINRPQSYIHKSRASKAIQRARALAPNAHEQAYIDALATRYLSSQTVDHGTRSRTYADAMRELTQRYPEDPDGATLFAAALMELRPWAYWTPDGQPAPDTLEIVQTLERVLQHYPDHPGAIHYYIHALEASPYPERALPYAQRLPALVPGIGHLVHMPSHIYMRLGRYAEAVESNTSAIQVDEAASAHQGGTPRQADPHNLDALRSALSMEGRSMEALKVAQQLTRHASPDMVRLLPAMEPWTAMPLCTFVRFGKWAKILQEPRPPPDLQYVTAIWHYARALALVAR